MGYRLGLAWVIAFMLGLPTVSSAAFKYFDPLKPNEVPQLLSQTGFYTNISSKTTDTAAKLFTVNSALWSDGSVKKRWVILRPGRKILWVDDIDLFDYPDSTVFVKSFQQVRAPGDTIYWETRFFVKKADSTDGAQNWWGYSYRWNSTQSDANLIDVSVGANAVLAVKDNLGRTSYRKWRFPSQKNCNLCHQVYSGGRTAPTDALKMGRAVLGFFPAQLKKTTQNGVSNQVLDLFAAGVFTGTQPNATALAKRFIGMAEPIKSSVTGAQRAALLDTMARSYLAANCSGCHSERAKSIGTTAALIPPNFDYYDLRHHDKAFQAINTEGSLNDTTSYTDSLSPIGGRNKYKWLVSRWGMSSDPNWSLSLPPGNLDTMTTREVYFDPATNRGYPALSRALFRQWSRNTPDADSATWYRALKLAAGFGDADAQAKMGWMFSKPWGSQEWQANLATHNFTLDSVMAGTEGKNLYGNDPEGMPPLATYVPDTAALRILGEWVVTQAPMAGIRNGKSRRTEVPYIRDRLLIAPPGWTGTAQMLDIRGRVVYLVPLANGRYTLPKTAKDGVYFFRIGEHFFKASILR
jgi:hypothetical protein